MDIPSLIPRWIYDPDTGKDPTQDPQRSWNRDPDIKPVPTDEDAYAAARYKRQYGDPNTRAIDIGDPYQRENALEYWNRHMDMGPHQPPTKGPITPQETDYLRKGQLFANQTPATYGQFDPANTSISQPGVQSQYGGLTDPFHGHVWVESSRDSPSTVGHEYGHAAYMDLYKNVPEARNLMLQMQSKFITPDDLRPENGFTLHELLTRGNMQRNFGPDVEGTVLKAPPPKPQPGTRISYGGGPGQYQMQRTYEITQNPEFKVMMRQLDKMAAHRGAQKLIERQGGVFQEGGIVSSDLNPGSGVRYKQRSVQRPPPDVSDDPRDAIKQQLPAAEQAIREAAPKMQQGGAVMPMEINDPENRMRYRLNDEPASFGRSPLRIPIGQGELTAYPTLSPGQMAELDAYFSHPIGPNTDVGVQGFVRQPMYEPGMKRDWGVGAVIRKKFQQGGKMWDDSPFGNWGTSDILHVARGAPGYEHLQQAAQDYLEKIEGHQRQGDTPGSYVAAGVRDVRSIPNEELKDNRKTFKDLAVEENRYPTMQAGGPVQQGGQVRRPYVRFIEPHVAEFQTDPTYPLQGEDDDDREPPPPGSKMGTLGPAIDDDDDDDGRNYLMPIGKEPDPSSIEGQVLRGERQSANEQLEYEEEAPDEDEQQRRHGKSARESYHEMGEADRQRQRLKGYRAGGPVGPERRQKPIIRQPYQPRQNIDNLSENDPAMIREPFELQPYMNSPDQMELDTHPADDRVGKLMDDPEHGSWHDDGKFQIYTPHMSFFHGASPHELVDYFLKYHPDDHRLNLP